MELSDYPKELKHVEYHAKHIYNRLPVRIKTHIDYQDLIQAGYIGLWDASKRYDGRDTCSFSTYASILIRGKMLDTVREFDTLSNGVHHSPIKEWYYSLKFIPIYEEIESLGELDTDKIDLHKTIDSMFKGRQKRVIDRYLEGCTNVQNGSLEGIGGSMIGILIKQMTNQIKEKMRI